MVFSSASVLLQIVTWCCSVPSLFLNVLLILSIRREKSTSNKFRWFNSIFLYSVYSNTVLTVLFPLFHPTYIPARSLIYIVFIGPLAEIVPKFCLKFMYSMLVGIVTYQAAIAPITLTLRWLVNRKTHRYLHFALLICAKIFIWSGDICRPSGCSDLPGCKRISCTFLHYKNVRILFAVTSLPFPIAVETWMNFATPSQRLQMYSEKSHEDAIRKLTGGDYAYFAIDWNFCYLIIAFFIPFLFFFLTSLLFHRFYMKSIWNVPNDCIELGYNYSTTVNYSLVSLALQNFVLISLPQVFLATTVLFRWELGIRALPVSFGCVAFPVTAGVTLFVHFRAYRRQLGFMFIEFLRQKSVNIPIFVANQQHQPSTHYQVSTV